MPKTIVRYGQRYVLAAGAINWSLVASEALALGLSALWRLDGNRTGQLVLISQGKVFQSAVGSFYWQRLVKAKTPVFFINSGVLRVLRGRYLGVLGYALVLEHLKQKFNGWAAPEQEFGSETSDAALRVWDSLKSSGELKSATVEVPVLYGDTDQPLGTHPATVYQWRGRLSVAALIDKRRADAEQLEDPVWHASPPAYFDSRR